MTRRITQLGLALAGLLAIVGAALRLVPVTVPTVAVEARETFTVPEPPTGDQQAATLLSFTDIVSGNLLAPDRRPPDERYTPPELAMQEQDRATPPAGPTAAAPRPPQLRLFGTAVGPQGSVALIDADPSIPGAEVYRVGDRINGARIEEIRETAVVLVGPGGRYTISLPTSIRRVP